MWPLRRVLLLGAALRCALLLVGAWQDAHGRIRYTDVDYDVFSDAARAMAAGGSPYERATYRYTPLLAAALLPNVWLHPAWCAERDSSLRFSVSCSDAPRRGKLLFCAADLGCAALTADVARRAGASSAAASAAAAAALFNPFTAAVSTRGSCDALSVLLLLATLRAALRRHAASAGALLGAAAHLRVYPVVHALPLALFFWGSGGSRGSSSSSSLRALVRGAYTPLRFCLAAFASFVALGAACFSAYGRPFLEHAYLYHAGRSDPRHNFSPAFYGAYLNHGAPEKLAAASRVQSLCQLAVIVGAGVALRRDPPAALLLQTLCFVAFNRVVTAQYFTWWMALAPLAAPALRRSPRLAAASLAWLAAQLHWLAHAAALEFGDPQQRHGAPFLRVWGASMLFFATNVWLLLETLAAYTPRDLRALPPKRD